MNHLTGAKFSKLENSRLSLIEKLKKSSQASLEASPFPGKWSVAQIFYHLNKAESLSVLYVSKKRLDIHNLKRTGLTEQIKMMSLRVRFALPTEIKAPDVLGDMPERVEYNSIVAEWKTTRNKLKDLLESLPDDMLHKNVFKQPFLGRLNIFQMLDFMQAHFNRHERQVERIIAKISS